MPRSLKKGPFVDDHLHEEGGRRRTRRGAKNVIKTWSRRSMIIPGMLGHTLAVHDGRKHVPGVRHRVDDRPQAGGVRSDPDVPRPREGRP